MYFNETLQRKFSKMCKRCYNLKDRSYHSYGGRGITVCRLWRRYPEKFIMWALAAGWRDGLDLDRIDPFGPYAPWNCRWLPHAEHMRLTAKTLRARGALLVYRTPTRHRKYKLSRNDVLYIHEHSEKSSQALAEELGVNRRTIWNVRCGGTWVEYHPLLGKLPQKRDWTCKKRISWERVSPAPKVVIKSAYQLQREQTVNKLLYWREYLYEHAGEPYANLSQVTGLSEHVLQSFILGYANKALWLDGAHPTRKGKTGLAVGVVRMIYLSKYALSCKDCAYITGVSRFVVMKIRAGKSHRNEIAALQDLPFYALLPVELLSRESFQFWKAFLSS